GKEKSESHKCFHDRQSPVEAPRAQPFPDMRDHAFMSFRAAGAKIDIARPFRRPSRVMKQPDHENQHGPLSYHGAWRIVWLVFLLIVVGVILRSLQPVILIFALVLLLSLVLIPIVGWLPKHLAPRSAT